MGLFKPKKSFKNEFRRQIRFAIVAAIGFTVAFAWRNSVYDSVLGVVQTLSVTSRLFFNEVFTAIIITVVAVIILLFTSRLLKE